jgi:formylglycine-generating enzyme required for sulfatase activity
MMGSESGPSDERPVEEQCFSEPFWIDRTEVTQADFARLGGDQGDPPAFAGGNRPVENIDWGEARSFCESRNMRLPSEREWEYVVRGPDNLSYPWGNEWDSNNTIWNGNSGGQTANVGSIPTDVTWVGALDMIGNVREWTNTVYNQELYPYPYRKLDGRETEEYLVGYLVRVVRGGSWDLARPNIGATKRSGEQHFEADNSKGFRCASFLN